MRFLDPILDLFRGNAVTIPPMDGALKPNTILDDAHVVAAAMAPDNIAVLNGALVYSSGAEIRQIAPQKLLLTCTADVTALASDGKRLAVALDDGSVLLDGTPVAQLKCPTALCFHDDALLVCSGSDNCTPAEWASDLMHRNAAGSLWRVDLVGGECRKLAANLAFANGVAVDSPGRRIIVSESWRHRLVSVPLDGGAPTEVLSRLPGYPSRICPTGQGYLLCLFAPLNRLVEFVLQEPRYRADMMREIESRYWIAPTLSPANSFLEPLQNGSVHSMGVHKPWSPTRSYGLITRLDMNLQPVASYHSRANGRFHGMTSAVVHDGEIFATSKGGNHLIRFPIDVGAQ
jgi:hypothetical protein